MTQYVPYPWKPGVSGGTLVSATELLHMETGIANNDVTNPASQAAINVAAGLAALSATYESGDPKTIYVSPRGSDSNTGKTLSTAKKTLAAALTAMGTGVAGMIRLGAGSISAGSGVSWTGYTCGLVGLGVNATVITTTAQAGPALDFSGVGYTLNGAEIGGFAIQGDGVANPANKGIVLSATTSPSELNMHDIYVRNTGGACFDLGIAELCDFNRLYAFEPISASASNIPYVVATGAFNGNKIRGLQLTGLSTGASVGASGAVVIQGNGTYAPEYNTFDSPAFENLHLPTGGTIMAISGNSNTIVDPQPFDCGNITGATGTSHFRFTPPVGSDSGGNLVLGVIPGYGGAALSINSGVDMRQGRNSVIGTKGYRGTNVIIASGIGNTYTALGGAVSSATDPAVVDNSGLLTNITHDNYNQLYTMGKYAQQPAVNLAGPQFFDPATPANGGVEMGNTGTRLQAVGVGAYLTTDTLTFQTIALTSMGYVDKFAGWYLHGAIQLANPGTQTTAPAAGAAAALPATPAGYVTITIAGTARLLPYY